MEYVTAETLGMGDSYRHSVLGEPIGPISWVDDAHDDHRLIRVDGFYFERLNAYQRVYVTERAPKCPCGVRFENCENECIWPDWLEFAYNGRP